MIPEYIKYAVLKLNARNASLNRLSLWDRLKELSIHSCLLWMLPGISQLGPLFTSASF